MSSTATHWTELARRTGNGIDAALLWSKSNQRVKVCLSDGRLCHYLDFEVASALALSEFKPSFVDAVSRIEEEASHE